MVTFVATPIGNLKDITLRALELLKEADVVFCEDTRHTLKLLNAYEIKKTLFACHKFNEETAAEKIIERAREGENVVVVSDAGMPVISDPGNVVCSTAKGGDYLYGRTGCHCIRLRFGSFGHGCIEIYVSWIFTQQKRRKITFFGTL